ncbi:MAG: polysaccharide pyruvyl transferase CsaB [Syntrophomonadaceae bacterium]|nr:polysaccharide pyruvyl transferase CsaB [Syntrophomonadaceae bacterium]MDD3889493.1 polysaccharide pyruvyl transferase CsaB [Syntrophomonadaceae bacterium]MDD4548905.1 polysaccharide pyruvyl transferase CsaB [Syntrophomonadaceae bacterium]
MKIALSGYYGFDNAGDEALLSAITSTIKRLQPAARFVVLSGYPGKTARLHGLRAVNRINPWSVTRELLESDLLISGGGSLFQDVTGPFSLPYYISVVALAKMLGKPVIFYAQGVGPIDRWYSKLLMRLIANRVEIITLRDEDSARLLREIGVTRPPIKVTADPVFTLEPGAEASANMQELLNSYFPSGKIVGVSVRKWEPLGEYQPDLALVLDRLVRQGYQILFIPMDYPADLEESHKVASLMQEESVVLERNFSSEEHVALIANLELMIGMRLHSLIFAASQNTPFLGISYDPKIDAFLKLFDLKPLSRNVEEINQQVDELLQNNETRLRIATRAAELRALAEETAHLALSLV